MYGVLAVSRAHRVIIICSGKFTQQAIDFASDKPSELLGGSELLSLIRDVQADSGTKTIIGASTQASCPRCCNELVERQAKRGANAGSTFLGCASFPKCRYTE